jgi:hypothetical protein
VNWSDAGERLWTLAGPALTGAQAVLIRVDPDWTGLELLASPEWCDAVVPLDATAFGFTPAAVVSLGPWLDQLDALTAGPATWRINPWALRLADPAATEAAQASVDALVAGLREVALVVAARLGPTPTPIAVLTGLAAEVGVVTVSAAAPGLVLPVQDGDERAYVALGPGRRAELYTSSRRRWIDHPDGLQPGGRGAEDHELWEVPERLDGLDLITRHLSGEPVELPAPRGQAVAPRQPGPAASAAVIDEVIVALEAALAPQLSGPDADALLAPGLGRARRRGAGRDQGHRHLPHRRVHAVGRRPRGPLPGHPRPRGRGRRVDVGPGVTSAEEGRPRDPALHARVPPVQVLPVAQDQPLHRDPRDAGQGPDARRHQPLLARRQSRSTTWAARPSRTSRAARDRGGEDPRGRAVRQGLLHRLRRHHRHRRGDQHRQGGAGRQRRRVRPRRHRPQRDPGRAPGRRRT